MESYCTKKCSECAQREVLGCPGCKNGPGMYPCECEIAACCHEKDHENCTTCTRNHTCAKFRRKERISVERKQEQEEKEKEELYNREKAGFLGKYIKILLWLVVPNVIGSLLSNANLGEIAIIFPLIGMLLRFAVSVIYGVVLLKMSLYDEDYGKSGKLILASGAILLMRFILRGGDSRSVVSLLLSIPAAVCAILSEYREFTAHGDIMKTLDYELSESWKSLRSVFVVFISIMYASMFLTLYASSLLGLLLFFISSVGTLVVDVLKIVKLYKIHSCLTYYSYE